MKFLNLLTEAGISFGGKAYPRSDNVVILAGGAGSGKGHVLENILLINGKVFDVDKLKTDIIDVSKKANDPESKSKQWLKNLTSGGVDRKFQEFLKSWVYGNDKKTDDRIREIIKNGQTVGELTLKDSINTGILHAFADFMNTDTMSKNNFFDNLASNPNLTKPNVIFDVTLKNTKALAKIYRLIQKAGYSPLNTHLVWILNDISIAQQQNKERSRMVDDLILQDTHEGASKTMNTIVNTFNSTIDGLDGVKISDMIQGDVWIVPNQKGVDSVLVTKEIPYIEDMYTYQNIKQYVPKKNKDGTPKKTITLATVKSFEKYQVKERGKPIKTLKDVENAGVFIFNNFKPKDSDRFKFVNKGDIKAKINDYVPASAQW